jgi:hypothetical protein
MNIMKFTKTAVGKFVTGVAGTLLVGVVAGAATLWIVSLNSGSSGQGQSPVVSNITISAVASPAPTNLLYPGGVGDVVATITNPNSGPVTLTAVQLPLNTIYAGGFTASTLSVAQTGCGSTTSLVSWNFSTGVTGSSHVLTSALTVGANSSLVVTFTNDALMSFSSPAACENTYFSLPSLTNVTATLGAATATTSPATSGWTS